MNMNPFLENSKQIALNKGKSLVHNLDDLQKQSLILASLVLVGSRIFVANVSALQAKGSPEGPLRYRESIRTDIREILGWTAGFVVLRQLQKAIQKGMAWAMEIEKIDNSDNEFSILKALKELRKNGTFKPFTPDPTIDLTPKIKLDNSCTKFLLKHFKFLKPNSMEPGTFVRQVYKLAPIGLASIPTIMLAGAYLERVTRDHSDHVVDFISQHLGSGAKVNSANQPVAPAALPAPAVPFQRAPQQPYNYRFTGKPSSPWNTPMPPRLPMGYPLNYSGR